MNNRVLLVLSIAAVSLLPWVSFSMFPLLLCTIAGLGALHLSEKIGTIRPAVLSMEPNKAIVLNPKEWPKYIAVIIIEYIAYYLTRQMNHVQQATTVYWLDVAFIVIVAGFPGFVLFIITVINRNDKIIIDTVNLSWYDNKDHRIIPLKDITDICIDNKISWLLFSSYHIRISVSQGTEIFIPAGRMNFTEKDIRYTMGLIRSKIKSQS